MTIVVTATGGPRAEGSDPVDMVSETELEQFKQAGSCTNRPPSSTDEPLKVTFVGAPVKAWVGLAVVVGARKGVLGLEEGLMVSDRLGAQLPVVLPGVQAKLGSLQQEGQKELQSVTRETLKFSGWLKAVAEENM
jgi:hypothetical protein